MSLLRNRALLAATFGHFSVDMYSGMLPLILLALTDPLGLSYSQVGFVSMIYSVAGSVSQPLFGWLGDQRGARPMAVVGVAAIATTVGVMRFVDSFFVLLVLAVIAGLGSGAFHPQGATLAAQTTNEQRGMSASIFMLGGNSGYAFGPLVGTAAFALGGVYMPEMLAMLGLAQAAIMFWLLAERQRQFTRPANTKNIAATVMAPVSIIITLTLVIFFRSWMSAAVSTYIPQVYKALGYSNVEAGNILFAILLPLAIGGLIGGTLSDKIGRRHVLIVSTALSGPALWALLQTTGVAAYLCGAVLGVAIGASFPVTLVMAQSLVPRGLGLMSGIVLGFTFIAGAIGVAISGVAADQIGLMPTMNFNALLPIIAAVLAFFLPEDRPALAANDA
jgi:MFS transporter, FSR family, fosmidomycin resistance protein